MKLGQRRSYRKLTSQHSIAICTSMLLKVKVLVLTWTLLQVLQVYLPKTLAAQSRILSEFTPFGFQSGGFAPFESPDLEAKPSDDDSYAGSIYFDTVNQVVYITGGTYSKFWDAASNSDSGGDSDDTHLTESDCFVAALKVPHHDDDDEMKLLYSRRIGVDAEPEVCSDVTALASTSEDRKVRLMTTGHTNEKGFLTSLRSTGSERSKVYGTMLNLEFDFTRANDVVNDASAEIKGAHLIHDSEVQYPIAIATDHMPADISALDYDAVYVASIASFKDDHNVTPLGSEDHPDLTTGGGLDKPEYGNKFHIVLQKLVFKSPQLLEYEAQQAAIMQAYFQNQDQSTDDNEDLSDTMSVAWSRIYSPLPLHAPEDGSDDIDTEVRVSDLLYIPRTVVASDGDARDDVLVMVGSTTSYGEVFGGDQPPIEDQSDPYIGKKYSGFLTKIDPALGEVSSMTGGTSFASRFGNLDSNDFIRGACFQRNNDNVLFLYIVGETNGLLDQTMKFFQLSSDKFGVVSNHAFVSKIRVDSLEEIWTRQVGSRNGGDVIGNGCEVTSDGETVYLAGTVLDDTIKILAKDIKNGVDNNIDSKGKNDIFVASFKTTDGSMNFLKQVGTSDNDSLAKGSGITSDDDGNAILFGNSKGSFARSRVYMKGEDTVEEDSSDIFVISVDRDSGDVINTAEKFDFDPNLDDRPEKETSEDNSEDADFEDGDEEDADDEIDDIIKEYLEEDDDNEGSESLDDSISETSGTSKRNSVVVIAFFVFTILIVLTYGGFRSYDAFIREKESERQDEMMKYLEDFDDKQADLHVRQSATGGIHGIYDFESKNGGTYVPGEVTVSFEPMKGAAPTGPPADLLSMGSSDVLKDALFMDDDSELSSLKDQQKDGARNKDDVKDEEGHTYQGLVDSYNSSWSERSQHTLEGVEPRKMSAQSRKSPPQTVFESQNTAQSKQENWDLEII